MNRFSSSLTKASAWAVTLSLFSTMPIPLAAISPSPISQSSRAEQLVASSGKRIRFNRPSLPKRGAPTGRYRGGGSKGECPPVDQPLTALVPVYPQNADRTRSVWALTVSDRPTFWFYIPYTLTHTLPVEFVLQDSQKNTVYQADLTQKEASPGIVKVELPSTVAPLKVGEQYRWYFIIQCDSIGTHVEGIVERQAPSSGLQRELQGKNGQEQAAVYAANGVWYDSLTILGNLHRNQSSTSDVLLDWKTLLQSADLEPTVINAPIVECCTPTQP